MQINRAAVTWSFRSRHPDHKKRLVGITHITRQDILTSKNDVSACRMSLVSSTKTVRLVGVDDDSLGAFSCGRAGAPAVITVDIGSAGHKEACSS